jgi:hypothetical protein
VTAANRSTADRLIAAKGQAVTLTRRASGAYDPATGTATITTTIKAGKGVILPLTPYRKAMGNIVQGDRQLLLSAIATDGTIITVPHVDDTVTLADGTIASIIGVDPLSPAGLDILYDCLVRLSAS